MSVKKIAVIGSTGSIGKTVLKIINKNKKNFLIIFLKENKNYKELLNQTKKFDVKNVIISDYDAYLKLKKLNKNKKLKIFSNFDDFHKIFRNKIQYSMSSIVGIEGLKPTLDLIKYTKVIAIANKESIICGWNLIDKQLKKFNTRFIPVDSEHFSIWYAYNHKIIHKIILTASGGSLLNVPKKKIKNIKIDQVLNHPNWKMGRKITVDSSNMMNKVFEAIEAKNIFNCSLKKISILIHPDSYVHAIVSYEDGMIKIIAHDTTMGIPIFNSIYENSYSYNKNLKINIDKLNKLNFQKIDIKKFPLVKILKKIPNKISLFETILVSANDELVRMYLRKLIKYEDISKKLLKIVNNEKFLKFKKISPKKVNDIIELDRYVRLKINTKGV